MDTTKQANDSATAPTAKPRSRHPARYARELTDERANKLVLVGPDSTESGRIPVLIREVIVGYRGPKFSVQGRITCAEDAVRFVRKVVRDSAREHMYALYLDGSHSPIAYQLVSLGTATSALVHPREIFQPAVLVGAVAIIALHNHPSGDVMPSKEDRQVTRQLYEAGKILNIRLLDHVIWTEGDLHTSLRDEEPGLFCDL